jgi:hypothetical protein
MRRFVEGADRGQTTLFPECLEDWIGADNTVRVIDVFVEELDLAGLGFGGVDPEATGRPSYHPSVLLKLYMLKEAAPRVSRVAILQNPDVSQQLAENYLSIMTAAASKIGLMPLKVVAAMRPKQRRLWRSLRPSPTAVSWSCHPAVA